MRYDPHHVLLQNNGTQYDSCNLQVFKGTLLPALLSIWATIFSIPSRPRHDRFHFVTPIPWGE
jgi:hypothetical protein